MRAGFVVNKICTDNLAFMCLASLISRPSEGGGDQSEGLGMRLVFGIHGIDSSILALDVVIL